VRWLIIFPSVLAAVGLAALLADGIPVWLRWLRRIHLGRWQDPAVWLDRLRQAGRRQAKHMPRIPASDQTRGVLWDVLRGQYTNRRLQLWQRAALVEAAEAFDAPTDWFVLPESTAERDIRAEHAAAAYALLKAGRISEQDLRTVTDELTSQAGSGTLPYTPALPALRFVDTLMACPALFRAGGAAADLSFRQLREYAENGLSPVTGWPAHCFRPTPDNACGIPLGMTGWGRGCGFWICALTESLTETADPAVQAWLLSAARKAADALLPRQLPGGGWSRQLLADDRPESSATAMIGYALALLSACPALPESDAARCRQAAQAARTCLMSLTRRDGTVDFAQGDTRAVGVYSTRTEPLPLAQAYAIRLGDALISRTRTPGR
jgi:unsaturated rhamnogalacturonyl hydrolase